MSDARFGLRVSLIVLAALAVGIAIWTIGQLRPGVDSRLAREGGRSIPLRYDLGDGLEVAMARIARRLADHPDARGVELRPGTPDALPALIVDGSAEPGPGYLPPRILQDGRRAWRPTPDRAEALKKRAFNALAERIDRRAHALDVGAGRVTLPAGGEMRLEVTPDMTDRSIDAILSPGALSVHRGDATADRHDVVGASLDERTLRVRLTDRASARLGRETGAVIARIDGRPVARADVYEARLLVLEASPEHPHLDMWIESGPLPMAVERGPARAIAPGR